MKAGLGCQQHAASECPEEKQGGHPGLTKRSLFFLGWLKPPTTNCIWDAELCPARGQPVAHPALHHLKAAKAVSAVIQLNPQSPAQNWHFPVPSLPISAPERLGRILSKGIQADPATGSDMKLAVSEIAGTGLSQILSTGSQPSQAQQPG